MEVIQKKQLHTIFQKWKQNKEEGMTQLYQHYQALMIRIAFSVVKNQEDSQDIIQNVFAKLMKLPPDQLPKEKEATWLYRVIKNEAIDFLKKQKPTFSFDEVYEISQPDKELEEIIEIDSYQRLMQKLTPREQEIVSLKIVSQLSFREIGELLNKPTATISWIYYKALHTLKALLVNFFAFVVAISLYYQEKNQKKEIQKETTEEEKQDHKEISNVGIAEDSQANQEMSKETNQIQTDQSVIEQPAPIPKKESFSALYFGLATFFLIGIVVFSLILAKHHKNKKRKSFKP